VTVEKWLPALSRCFLRFLAPAYRQGHAGEPGEDDGVWLLWIAADTFETRQGGQNAPSVDREFSHSTACPRCRQRQFALQPGELRCPFTMPRLCQNRLTIALWLDS
jgi:hypothetical protein